MKAINPILSIIAILLAGGVLAYQIMWKADAPPTDANVEAYQPRLQSDPPIPEPPKDGVRDFRTFLTRFRKAAEDRPDSLVLHRDAAEKAEAVFRSTPGVPENVKLQMHAPFYSVDPQAVFELYYDLPTLERGLALYQQNCSSCHGPYGRGNGSATQQWYSGNYPRNFWYGRYKSRSTKYGTVPTDRDIFRTLTRGLYGSTMPSFRHLSEKDRWALVQFVKTLANFYDDFDEVIVNRFDPKSNESVADPLDIGDEPPASLDTVKRGRFLFVEQGCVSCHQGKKDEPVGLARWEGGFENWNDEMDRPISHSRDLTTKVYLSGAASTDLYRIISGGPTIGPMPSYQNLPKQDRWALVHYVRSLFDPKYPRAPK